MTRRTAAPPADLNPCAGRSRLAEVDGRIYITYTYTWPVSRGDPILVVEDDDDNREVLAQTLTVEGASVVWPPQQPPQPCCSCRTRTSS
jgi:hypothetical protein